MTVVSETDTPFTRLATPDLPRGEIQRSELARTVLGEVASVAREEAKAQGYAVGWAQGRRDAAASAAESAREAADMRAAMEIRRNAEHTAAIAALTEAATQVRGMLDALCEAIEDQSTELAWELTRTLVDAQVAVATGPDVVRRVLAVLPQVPFGTVRLAPATAADPALSDLAALGLVIEPDPTLGPADALVEANGSVTDLRISSAMERVRAVLNR